MKRLEERMRKGKLIALLPMVLKGLFGLGYYVTVPALCIAAVILLNNLVLLGSVGL